MAVPGMVVPGVVVPGVVVPGLDWPTLGRVVPDAPGVAEPGWVLIPGFGEGAGAGLVGPLPAPGVPELGPGLLVCANAAPATIRPTPAIARLESSFRCMVWVLLECGSITPEKEQHLCHAGPLAKTPATRPIGVTTSGARHRGRWLGAERAGDTRPGRRRRTRAGSAALLA
jgi:hypothetical protein